MPDTPVADDFDAAKKVFDELKGLTKESQERVLRWVAETLGVKGLSAQAPAAASHADSGGSPAPQSATLPAPSGSRDIRTFVSEKAPTSENQFAAVVAYYYRFEAPEPRRRNSIGGADLQEAARLAGRKRLSNPRQTLKNAKALGYLDNPGRGEYSINTVGENLVAMTLPGSADGAVRPGPRRKVAKRSKPKQKKGAK